MSALQRPPCPSRAFACFALILLTCLSCSAPSPPPPRGKPAAPVDVSLTSSARPDGRVDLLLRATPHRDTDALELSLGTHRIGFPATRAGTTRQLSLTLAPGATTDGLAGAATLVVDGRRLSRAALLPSANARTRNSLPAVRRLTLPGDIPIAETRAAAPHVP